MALGKKCRHPRSEWRKCGCAWWWNGYIDGRRVYRSLGSDRAAARRQAAQIEADRLSDRAAPAPRVATVAAVAERWIDNLEDHGRRPQTLRAYRTAANAVVGFFGPNADVKRIDADAMLDFETKAFTERRGHGARLLMQALRGILGQAHRERLITAVPTPPRERRSIEENPGVMMTEEEAERTIAELRPDHWRELANLIVLTGLRIGEALALRWEDLDEKAGTLRVRHNAEQRGRSDAPTKTRHSTRRMRLEPEAVELLKRQARSDERIFPRSYAAALTAIRRAMDRAGTYERDRGWHSYRHLNAALRDRAGQSIRQAGAELGHGANFVMTASYGWASEAGEPAPISRVRHERGSSNTSAEESRG